MANTSIVTLLARDIAAGLRDGLALRDASGFAWAMNPKATWSELSRAPDKAKRLHLDRDTQSPMAYLAGLAALELAGGASDEQAAAAIWSLRKELSQRQLALVIRFAKKRHGLD